jgi:hypothetical protein
MSYHTDSAAKERTMVRNERKAMGSNIHKQSVLLFAAFLLSFHKASRMPSKSLPIRSPPLHHPHPIPSSRSRLCTSKAVCRLLDRGERQDATFSTVLFVLHKPLSNHAVRMGTWELNFGDDKEKQPEEEVVGVD